MTTPAVSPTALSTDRCSLRTIRERLGPLLGSYVTGAVSEATVTFEAERYLISSDVLSDAADAARFDGLYVYIRDGAQAGAVRMLIPGTYDAPLGALLADRPFEAPLAGGDTFEIGALPVTPYLGVGGVNDAINQGLETLTLTDTLTLTSDGTRRVSLAEYQWPIKRIRRILRPGVVADAPAVEYSGRFSLELDAELPYLQMSAAFPDGDDFTVEVDRPMHTRVGSLGVWSDTATGLVNDADEVMVGVGPAAGAALPIALRLLAQASPRGSDARAALLDEADVAGRRAAVARFFSVPRGNSAQRIGAR
jgi:hypothetical protein